MASQPKTILDKYSSTSANPNTFTTTNTTHTTNWHFNGDI